MSSRVEGGQGPIYNPEVFRPEGVSDDVWRSFRSSVMRFSVSESSTSMTPTAIETTPSQITPPTTINGRAVEETTGI